MMDKSYMHLSHYSLVYVKYALKSGENVLNYEVISCVKSGLLSFAIT